MSGNLCINEVESCTITDAPAMLITSRCVTSDLYSPMNIILPYKSRPCKGSDFFAMEDKKQCTKCKTWRPLDEFKKSSKYKCGHVSQCLECERVYARMHHAKHCEEHRAYSRQWNAAHKNDPKVKERHRKHSAKYRKTHPWQARLSDARWYAANKDKSLARWHLRRARKLAAGGRHTAADIRRQGDCQNWKCWWQGPGCTIDCRDKYEVDHMIPLARGGHNYPGNIVISCQHCNRSKKDKMPEEWAGGLL